MWRPVINSQRSVHAVTLLHVNSLRLVWESQSKLHKRGAAEIIAFCSLRDCAANTRANGTCRAERMPTERTAAHLKG